MDKNELRLTAFCFGELNEHDHLELERRIAVSPELQTEIAKIRQLMTSLFEALDQDLADAHRQGNQTNRYPDV